MFNPIPAGKGVLKIKLLNISEKKSKTLVGVLLGILAVIIIFIVILKLSSPEPFEATTYAMGTYVQQTVYGGNPSEAAEKGANAVVNLENEISWRIVDSDIAAINEAAGKTWTQVSDSTYSILSESLDVCEKSGGDFDITIAPLSLLWNFDDSPTAPPSDGQIQKFLPYVDYTKLRSDPNEKSFSFKNTGYAVDLGAIGKGAACDAVVKEYAGTDIEYGIVAVGGSVGTYGKKPFGSKWNIAVRDPEGGESIGSLSIEGGFVSTSGSYEKRFEYEGREYHHILDPKTGYPVENGLVSVTIVGGSGALSDALSTACFVKGYDESLELLHAYGAGGIFVYADKSVQVTENLKDSFSLSNKNYHIE